MASQKSKDWVKLVPLCTWLMNNQVHSATGFSPAELFFGRPTWMPDLVPEPDANPNVQSWIQTQMEMEKVATDRLKKLRAKQLTRVNRGRRTAQYRVNDYVLVHRRRFPQWTCPKLSSQWFGPYRVIQVKHSAVIVRASPRLGGEVEVAYDFLKHFPTDPREDEEEIEEEHDADLEEVNQPEPIPDETPDPESGLYEVESIETHKYKQGWRFLTVWKGYSLQDATWEPIRAFVHPDGCLTRAFVDYCESKGLTVPLKNAKDLASRPTRMQISAIFRLMSD